MYLCIYYVFCVKKIELAKAIGKNTIKYLDDNGFTSLQDKGKEYKSCTYK